MSFRAVCTALAYSMTMARWPEVHKPPNQALHLTAAAEPAPASELGRWPDVELYDSLEHLVESR